MWIGRLLGSRCKSASDNLLGTVVVLGPGQSAGYRPPQSQRGSRPDSNVGPLSQELFRLRPSGSQATNYLRLAQYVFGRRSNYVSSARKAVFRA